MAAGHTMILEGHKTVAEGWRMFEEAVDESVPRDLPQLLQQLKEKTKPMPPPSPMDIGKKELNSANQFQQCHHQLNGRGK